MIPAPLISVGAFDYHIVDANDPAIARVLADMNGLFPDDFYDLDSEHFQHGLWLVATTGPPLRIVGFAGSVPFRPFDNFLYFKRVAVLPEYRGNSIQRIFMQLTESYARKIGYTHLISTTDIENIYSANNFIKTGWQLTKPEKPWEPTSLYWIKKL
jgi:GNAT superfamily N-acetyltransferase